MQKTMFEIKCSECGKTAMVPFKPTAGKPAYCKTCFSKRRFTQSESASNTNGFDSKQAWARRRENNQITKAADQPIARALKHVSVSFSFVRGAFKPIEGDFLRLVFALNIIV